MPAQLKTKQFGIIQVLQSSPIQQTSNWSGTFFVVSYSKPALELHWSSKKYGYLELLYSLLACCHLVKRFQWRFGVSWIENKSYIWTHSLYNWYLEDKYRIENISDTHHMINEFPIFTSFSTNQNMSPLFWLKQTKTQYLVRDIKPPILFSPIFPLIFISFISWKRKQTFHWSETCFGPSLFPFWMAKTEKNSWNK